MRIGIYVDVARGKEPTGIGLHIRNLVDAIADCDHSNQYLLYYPHFMFTKEVADYCFPHRSNLRVRPVPFPVEWNHRYPRIWWDWLLPRVLCSDAVDVFHGPNHYLPAFDREKTVVTIHDLALFKIDSVSEGDHASASRHWTRKAIDRAGMVIALSENTKRDVLDMGVDPSRIKVIHGGGHFGLEAKASRESCESAKQSLGLPNRYILFVGTLQPRKNLPLLIRAFASLRSATGFSHKLVLAGQRSTAAAEVESLIDDLGLGSEVVITGYVEDRMLPAVYQMADLFVLPASYEGFGMVLLEAMAMGVPVVATDTSCLREVVGDAARLVPPDDVEALALAMRKLIDDQTHRHRLIRAGAEHATTFTWERNARETIAVYEYLYKTAISR